MRLFAVVALICLPLNILLFVMAPTLWFILEAVGVVAFVLVWRAVADSSWPKVEE